MPAHQNGGSLVVSFQGLLGSYSHEAALALYPDAAFLERISFDAAIDAVIEGDASNAIIPVENSRAGRVADVHNLLAKKEIFIVQEHFHPVRHCLLGSKNSTKQSITKVISHPQALGQCKNYLALNEFEPIRVADTAQAAQNVARSQDDEVAAIASKACIKHYAGLTLLDENIQDQQDNTTRFFVVSKESDRPKKIRKTKGFLTAIFFETKNVPSSLMMCLTVFASRGINVTNIESFVAFRGTTNGGAEFYLEMEGSYLSEKVSGCLGDLNHFANNVRVIGCFERKEI